EFKGKQYLDLIQIQFFEIPVIFPKSNVFDQKYLTFTFENISLQPLFSLNSHITALHLLKYLIII
ncbi:MAG: hypothetical protein ACXACY_23730, partial [Candidatus Hodarchaeales archaeon]